MGTINSEFETRVRVLERQLRWMQVLLAIVILAVTVSAFFSGAVHAQDQKALRLRTLVVEDAAGRDRIVFGAPLPDPQGRVSPSTGMVINDPQGVERFAVGLHDNGRVVMGFDAPPGTGDPRNRERITLVADAAGGAYLRFLNRKTGVPGRLILGDDDQLYLEFLDSRDGETLVKRNGSAGERMIESKD
jgi:hypothetical protein